MPREVSETADSPVHGILVGGHLADNRLSSFLIHAYADSSRTYVGIRERGHCNCLDRRESARLQPIVREREKEGEERSGGGHSLATNVRFHAR